MEDRRETLLTMKRFTVVRHFQTLPDGTAHTHDSIQHPGAVVILPLLDDGRVVLIRNARVAVGETLIELPAGTLDHDEPPAATAERELAEETGYRAAHIEKLFDFYVSPGILNERMQLFLATGLTLGEKALEQGELISTLVLPWEQALELIDRGELKDAKSITGLLYYDRRRRAAQ